MNVKLNLTTSLFTVLKVQMAASLSRSWLESALRMVLESDDPFDSPFTAGFLFTGASVAKIQLLQDARSILQQRNAWNLFHAQEGLEQQFARVPHLYHNDTIWRLLRLHNDTAGSFLTALAPQNHAQSK